MCFQFRPGHSGMCECSFQFRLWSINFETLSFNFVLCHPFSSTAIQIRRSQYLTEHETAKTISSIGIHFRQSFNQIRLPGVEAQTNLNDKILNLFEGMTNLILHSLLIAKRHRRISVTIDKFECWISKVDWQNTNVNDNLTKLNFRFERSKLLRTKLNWKFIKLMAEVTKIGGKTYIKLRNNALMEMPYYL